MGRSSILPPTAMNSLGMMAALKSHNKAIGGAMSSVQGQVIEGQKSQISVDQEVEKLKLVKSKLEWTNLVEKMSKDTSNVIVLKQPEIKKSFEQSSPKLLINLLLGILFGFFASVIVVIFAEQTDKTLTYSDLGDRIIYNIADNIDDLKILLLANSKETMLIVDFDGFQSELLKRLEGFSNFKIIKSDITPKTIEEIANAKKLVFAAKIGETPKKIYKQIKTVCDETNGFICTEVV